MRKRVIPGVSSILVVGLAVSAAFLTTGFKPIESETSVDNVWISRGGSDAINQGTAYSRVNLSAGELDAFLSADDSGVTLASVGSSTVGVSGTTVFAVNDANPVVDLAGGKVAEADQLATGASISQIFVGGGTALLLDASEGKAFAGSGASFLQLKATFSEIEVPGKVLTGQVSTTGVIYLLVQTDTELTVRTYSLTDRKLMTSATLTSALATGAVTSLAVVGDQWAVLSRSASAESASVFTANALGGADISAVLGGDNIGGSVFEQRSAGGSRVFVGVTNGLIGVPLENPASAAPVDVAGLQTAAVSPLLSDSQGCVVGAWIESSANAGVVATICGDEAPTTMALSSPADAASGTATPVLMIRGNGANMVVNDVVSGRAWRLDGTPIASSWTWNDPNSSDQSQETVRTEQQVREDPEPPVANADAFSIRPGLTSLVPVLLNDTDPNGDPFYIAQDANNKARVEQPAPAGVSMQVVGDGTKLAVTVPRSMESGTIAITYVATDGTVPDSATGGLYSNRAAVNLTIVSDDSNSPPIQVQTDDSDIAVAAGGSAVVNVLQWWADKELDPLVVSAAVFDTRSQAAEASLVVQPDGSILFRHFGSSGRGPYQVSYTVDDGHGGRTEGELTFTITDQMTAGNFAVSTVAGSPVTIDLTSWVHGASSAAKVSTKDPTGVSFPDGLFGFVFTAEKSGDYRKSYVVSDKGSVSGVVLIHVAEPNASELSVAPMTLAVRTGAYQTVDVSSAVTGAGSDVALVSELTSAKKKVDAAVLDYSRVRVITNASVGPDDGGTTIDVLTFTVHAGDRTATGQISIYLEIPQSGAAAPVAVDDAVTVVSGEQVDIPVLDNDRDPNGGALSLNAAWTSQNPDGRGAPAVSAESGVYFPSGSVIRYLAPDSTDVTKTVTFNYEVIGSADDGGSGSSSRAQAAVTVTIVPISNTTATSAPTLTARVVSGGSVTIAAPTVVGNVMQHAYFESTAIDGHDKGIATIAGDRGSLTYVAPVVAASTTLTFGYTVQLGSGATAQGIVRVGVAAFTGNSAPIAVTDFVSVKAGQAARVDPVANDIATNPANALSLGTLKLRDATNAVAYEVGSTNDPDSHTRADPTVTISKAHGAPNTLVIAPIGGQSVSKVTIAYQVDEAEVGSAPGTIVVTFASGDVNVFPVISDTTVTAQDYSTDGATFDVDVVAGKVAWPSGDPNTLAVHDFLGLGGIEISGHTVTGVRHESTVCIPLSFTGTANDGTEVVGYGFLIVLGSNVESPSLKSTAAVVVNAGESHTFDIRNDVVAPVGSSVELVSVVPTSVEGTAVKDSDSTITYTANDDGGGADSVPFVLDYSVNGTPKEVTLAFSVTVISRTPDFTLVGREPVQIAAADSQSVSLKTLVTNWTGTPAEKEKLNYSITPIDAEKARTQLSAFSTVGTLDAPWTLTAQSNARSGTSLSFTLKVSSSGGTSHTITLEVRIVDSNRDLPKAASCTARIDLSGNAKIVTTIAVANAASAAHCTGEYNPFSGTDLSVSVVATSAPSGVGFVAQDGSISVTIDNPAAQVGGTVTVQFAVKDSQGRTSANSSPGRLSIELLARPATPALSVSAYDTSSVTFQIRQGDGSSADEYVLESRPAGSRGGTWSTAATASGPGQATIKVTDFGGGGSGFARDFRVYAKNSVDSSATSPVLSAVYPQARQDRPVSLSWSPDQAKDGSVNLVINGLGTTAEEWVITGGTSDRTVPNDKSVRQSVALTIAAGSQEITVAGKTTACGPCATAAGPGLASGTSSVTATAFGAPSVSIDEAKITSTGKSQVSFTPTMAGPDPSNPGKGYVATGDAWQWTYCVSIVTSQPTGGSCAANASGAQAGMVAIDGRQIVVPVDLDGAGTKYAIVTISNGKNTVTEYSGKLVLWPTSAALKARYSYSISPSTEDDRWFVPRVAASGPAIPGGFAYEFMWGDLASSNGDWTSTKLELAAFNSANVQVRACVEGECADWVALASPPNGDKPVAFTGLGAVAIDDAQCVAGASGVNATATIRVVTPDGTTTETSTSGKASVGSEPSPLAVKATGEFTFSSAAGGSTRTYKTQNVPDGTCTPTQPAPNPPTSP